MANGRLAGNGRMTPYRPDVIRAPTGGPGTIRRVLAREGRGIAPLSGGNGGDEGAAYAVGEAAGEASGEAAAAGISLQSAT